MKFATAINCMNGRTQLPVIAYLKEKCKVDCVDMVTEAGPVRILADSADRALVDSIKHRVEISVEKHCSRYKQLQVILTVLETQLAKRLRESKS